MKGGGDWSGGLAFSCIARVSIMVWGRAQEVTHYLSVSGYGFSLN